MRKENIIEERFKTVKKLVHDDPTALDIVERFHKEFSKTEKFRGKIYAVSKASIIMYITMIMYPCSGGTDTVSPGL